MFYFSKKTSFYFRDEERNRILSDLPGYSLHNKFWAGIGSALTTLAALTPDIFETDIIDENNQQIDYNSDYDMVAISAMTHQAIRAYRIAGEFKKRGITVILGGVHLSSMFDEGAKFADSVVVGEADNIWKELTSDFLKGRLKKFYFQKDYPPVDMKNLPVPRYDLLKNKNHSIVWLNSSRGCPYDCEFCSVTDLFGKTHRHKTVNQVSAEIGTIKKELKNIFIGFSDDNMFISRKFASELTESFKDLNFRWVCQSDISIGEEPEILKNLFKAGCHAMLIGFESLDGVNLKGLHEKGKAMKSDYLGKYERMISNIQESGIGVIGSFITGFDNDTAKTFDNIADFVEKTNMLTATLNVLTPLPGTRLRERLDSENRIIPTSWDNYTVLDVNIIPKNMTFREIDDGMIDTYRKIYSVERMKKTTAYFKNIYKTINKSF